VHEAVTLLFCVPLSRGWRAARALRTANVGPCARVLRAPRAKSTGHVVYRASWRTRPRAVAAMTASVRLATFSALRMAET
jgi:hypothetical protein